MHPTSKDPIISELNEIIYAKFPPTAYKGRFLYGRLYYLGDLTMGHFYPQWMLDGITPVGMDTVLGILANLGVDVQKYLAYFAQICQS